jgi:hypothetical protein
LPHTSLPVDTVDLLEHVIRTGAGNSATQADLTITRISVSTYATIPNINSTQGRPIQVWVNRQSGATNTNRRKQRLRLMCGLLQTVHRHISLFTGVCAVFKTLVAGANTQDIPFRFLTCLVSGLAYYLALKIPEALNRLEPLKQMYDEAWDLAAGEDREKAPDRLVPRRMYIS